MVRRAVVATLLVLVGMAEALRTRTMQAGQWNVDGDGSISAEGVLTIKNRGAGFAFLTSQGGVMGMDVEKGQATTATIKYEGGWVQFGLAAPDGEGAAFVTLHEGHEDNGEAMCVKNITYDGTDEFYQHLKEKKMLFRPAAGDDVSLRLLGGDSPDLPGFVLMGRVNKQRWSDVTPSTTLVPKTADGKEATGMNLLVVLNDLEAKVSNVRLTDAVDGYYRSDELKETNNEL